MMKKSKILIVDDNEMDLKLLDDYLSRQGYDVVTAPDGTDAFSQVQACNPDLVIMDIIMSKLSGWKSCEQIKNDPRYRNVPVLLCSSLIKDDSEFNEYGTGDGYIPKPVDLSRLLTMIQKFLNKE